MSRTRFRVYPHSIVDINNINIDEILVSNKISSGKKYFKYFIGYKDEDKIKPLCIRLSKICGYAKNFDETRYISF